MSAIFTGDGTTTRAGAQGDFKAASADTLARYQADSSPLAGPLVNRPGKRKTNPAELFGEYADDTQQKKARPAIKGGITERSADVLQKFFPSGESVMPQMEKSTVMSKSNTPVFFYDDHAMSHGFKLCLVLHLFIHFLTRFCFADE